MIILGLADNHDAGAALVIDGKLVGAINQERIDRKKGSGGFPWGAIDVLLKQHNVAYRHVDRVVVGSAFTPIAALRKRRDKHQQARSRGQFSVLLHGYMVYQSALRRSGLHTLEVERCRDVLHQVLQERPFNNPDLRLMDHHLAHAEGAYRTQPLDHCLVLTLDGMGDGLSSSAWIGHDGDLRPIWDQTGMAAINLFYSRITELLGFTPLRHEGKITGLAAYEPPPATLVEHFRQEVAFIHGKFRAMNPRAPAHRHDPFWSVVRDYSREEVAAAAQTVLEEAVLDFVQHWIEHTAIRDVVVAGGIFANVKLNQRIAALPDLDSLWVMPHMGDGGLPAGAALASSDSPPTLLEHAYLGPVPNDDDCFRALKRNQLPRNRDHIIERAAQLLSSGGVLARCAGGMEWGPRALGNRSILATAEDPSINDSLNQRLQRTEFMPFAPIVRDVDRDRYFVGLEKCAASAQFMTVCCPVTEEFQRSCPAAVHVDGTARPQILSKMQNPDLYALLTRVGELTGTPALINTSFNMHEEPIVCTADDGVRAYLAANLDGLWLGNFLVEGTTKSA